MSVFGGCLLLFGFLDDWFSHISCRVLRGTEILIAWSSTSGGLVHPEVAASTSERLLSGPLSGDYCGFYTFAPVHRRTLRAEAQVPGLVESRSRDGEQATVKLTVSRVSTSQTRDQGPVWVLQEGGRGDSSETLARYRIQPHVSTLSVSDGLVLVYGAHVSTLSVSDGTRSCVSDGMSDPSLAVESLLETLLSQPLARMAIPPAVFRYVPTRLFLLLQL